MPVTKLSETNHQMATVLTLEALTAWSVIMPKTYPTVKRMHYCVLCYTVEYVVAYNMNE